MKLAILQARSSSTRLPGKVLAPILGTPMILRQIERIRRSALLDDLVLATSTDSSDDELASVVAGQGITVRRGPLDDVFSRFALVVDEFRPKAIVRLTGDNPLADPAVIDAVLEGHLAAGADYTSNSRVRSYPYGLDVECVADGAFARLRELDLDAAEREHVTMALYGRPGLFATHAVVQEQDVSTLRWSVDYPEDFAFVTAVYEHLYPHNPVFGQQDVLDLIDAHPELRHTVDDVPQ